MGAALEHFPEIAHVGIEDGAGFFAFPHFFHAASEGAGERGPERAENEDEGLDGGEGLRGDGFAPGGEVFGGGFGSRLEDGKAMFVGGGGFVFGHGEDDRRKEIVNAMLKQCRGIPEGEQ